MDRSYFLGSLACLLAEGLHEAESLCFLPLHSLRMASVNFRCFASVRMPAFLSPYFLRGVAIEMPKLRAKTVDDATWAALILSCIMLPKWQWSSVIAPPFISVPGLFDFVFRVIKISLSIWMVVCLKKLY